jgi:hypothetical protein
LELLPIVIDAWGDRNTMDGEHFPSCLSILA